jgi:hypothetical protein
MKREDYGTMDQYINAFRQAVRQANRTKGTQIQPFAATLLMSRGVQNEIPMWATTIKYELSKRQNPNNMTEMELLDLCEKAIDRGKQRDRSYISKDKKAKPTQSSTTSKRRNNENSEKRNSPPRGMSIIKCVEKWLQGNQRNNENMCSFCEAPMTSNIVST